MKTKDFDKKRHILITGMKLFSSKNYNRTSMQEIAEICGISKGSLYVYYKSKEDLLLHILQYYFQYIEDQMMLIEKDTSLSATEKFMKEIELKLGHYIENQEFYRLQRQEFPGLSDKRIYRYLHQQNTEQIKWLEQSFINIYGSHVKPYAADGAFLLMGMIKQYMELIITKQLPLQLEKVVHFLVNQIDLIIKGLLDHHCEPLITEHLWSVYLDEADEERVHPLELIKDMKNQLMTLSISETQNEEAHQSLSIMEQELMSMHPRTAILNGMLHNLESIHSLKEMRTKLVDSIQMDNMHKVSQE